MATDTDSTAQLPTPLRRRDWLIVPFLLCVSILVLLAAYLTYNWPGLWKSSASPLSWDGSKLNLTQGQGYKESNTLTIDALGEKGIAVAAVVTKTFRARDYSIVAWNVANPKPDTEFVFLWRTAEAPAQLFSRALALTKDGIAPVDMLSDENWRGQIVGLALAVKGRLSASVVLKGVSVKPVTASQIMERLATQWLAAEGWDARSINFADANALHQDIPLLPAVAAVVLLALGLYFLFAIAHLARVHRAIVWALVFAGWLMLDMRWQWVLFNQLRLTAQQYAGKSWEAKHLASEDAMLFQFMRNVSAALPAASRILYLSDDPYSRGKGAYYLYPHNVLAGSDFALAEKCRTGDYIVVFAKKGVQYDESKKLLVNGGPYSIATDLLISAGENLLLRVR